MSSDLLTSFVALYGDVAELNFPQFAGDIDSRLQQFNWVQYNSRKPNNRRTGLSVTSLDGGLSGIPDLDSVREYNIQHNLQLKEADFNVRTPVVHSSTALSVFLDSFPDLGRCHFIKFGNGGNFPPHRDGGVRLPVGSFRIFCPVHNASTKQFVWLQEGRQLPMVEKHWYFVNTFKEHAVMSFVDDCIIFVANLPATEANIKVLTTKLSVL